PGTCSSRSTATTSTRTPSRSAPRSTCPLSAASSDRGNPIRRSEAPVITTGASASAAAYCPLGIRCHRTRRNCQAAQPAGTTVFTARSGHSWVLRGPNRRLGLLALEGRGLLWDRDVDGGPSVENAAKVVGDGGAGAQPGGRRLDFVAARLAEH